MAKKYKSIKDNPEYKTALDNLNEKFYVDTKKLTDAEIDSMNDWFDAISAESLDYKPKDYILPDGVIGTYFVRFNDHGGLTFILSDRKAAIEFKMRFG